MLSGSPDRFSNPLKIKLSDYNTYSVENLTSIPSGNVEEMLESYYEGNESKTLAENASNIFSSRSHTIFQIQLSSFDSKFPNLVSKSVLNIVDLAGSEWL